MFNALSRSLLGIEIYNTTRIEIYEFDVLKHYISLQDACVLWSITVRQGPRKIDDWGGTYSYIPVHRL